MTRYADLHMHTPSSDGTDTIDQRIQQAKDRGLDAIAITDHDAINSNLDNRKFNQDGVEVISGAEIKAEIDDTRIEILSLFLNPEDDDLQALIDKNREYRLNRMEQMVSRLNDLFNAGIDFEAVKKRSNGNPGRPHLGEELVKNNVAEDQNEAFNEFIGRDCEAYIPLSKVSARKVIETVHSNGGVTSLAHPGRDLTKNNADRVLEELTDMGLDGLEVEYTYRHKIQDGYDINFTEVHAHKLAERFDLIETGGSDCHGSGSNKFNIGKVKLDYGQVEKLKSRAEKYRP